jgi:hypothetical protein
MLIYLIVDDLEQEKQELTAIHMDKEQQYLL